jgi:Cysteine-rich secretory protein family
MDPGSSGSGWNGNVSACQEGSVSSGYLDEALQRIAYFREMAGLPGTLTLDATWNAKCQKAALMMSANNALNHYPPASWTCYSADGAEAAGKSNLALGFGTFPDAITGFILDGGILSAGHRRWVLYPPLATIGLGAIPSGTRTYAMWVIGGNGSRPASPEWVAWPPAGFVPYGFVSDLWSFSYPGADFSGATVSVTRNGAPVSSSLQPVQNGYGDNTLVWTQSGIPTGPPAQDIVYSVTVGGVGVGGSPRTFAYTVTAIDPSQTTAVTPTTWGALKARYR